MDFTNIIHFHDFYIVIICSTLTAHVLPCKYTHVLPGFLNMYCHVSPCITMYCHVLPGLYMYYKHVITYYHVYPCLSMYTHLLPSMLTHLCQFYAWMPIYCHVYPFIAMCTHLLYELHGVLYGDFHHWEKLYHQIWKIINYNFFICVWDI